MLLKIKLLQTLQGLQYVILLKKTVMVKKTMTLGKAFGQPLYVTIMETK